MKDSDYKNIREFTVVNGYLKPYNEKALEITTETGEDEIISFIEVTHRDIKFHRAYFDIFHKAKF